MVDVESELSVDVSVGVDVGAAGAMAGDEEGSESSSVDVVTWRDGVDDDVVVVSVVVAVSGESVVSVVDVEVSGVDVEDDGDDSVAAESGVIPAPFTKFENCVPLMHVPCTQSSFVVTLFAISSWSVATPS